MSVLKKLTMGLCITLLAVAGIGCEEQQQLQSKGISHFPVWKTVTVGHYMTANEMRKDMFMHGWLPHDDGFLDDFRHSNDHQFYDSIKLATSPKKLELVMVRTPANLRLDAVRKTIHGYNDRWFGFSEDLMYTRVYKWAMSQGLKPCPPEAALQLRMQYPYQPTDRYDSMVAEPKTIWMATEPPTGKPWEPMIYGIAHSWSSLCLTRTVKYTLF